MNDEKANSLSYAIYYIAVYFIIAEIYTVDTLFSDVSVSFVGFRPFNQWIIWISCAPRISPIHCNHEADPKQSATPLSISS